MTANVKTVVINSGQQISDAFKLANAGGAILHVPTITSCQLTLQVSPDTTSANYFTLLQSTGSAYLLGQSGVGSYAIALGNEIGGINARFLSGVAQASPRSLSLLVKI